MNETEIIRRIARGMRDTHAAPSRVFDGDAEFVTIGGEAWGISVDSFGPEEDLFTSEDPVRLGSNLATATLSDLLAAGVAPAFFLHALELPGEVSPAFVDGLAEGIRRVLSAAGCAFLGGDLGAAGSWRYVGVALGRVAAPRALTRVLPSEPQTLWTTGTLGDANAAALSGTPTPAFELRMAEAAALREHATGCIDTSGGFLDAVWTLADRNPARRFEIDLGAVPLSPGLVEHLPPGVPAVAALLGGAGEYELVFASPADLTAAARDALLACGATPVGRVTPGEAGVFVVHADGRVRRMEGAPPSARAASSIAEHVRDVLSAARRLVGET